VTGGVLCREILQDNSVIAQKALKIVIVLVLLYFAFSAIDIPKFSSKFVNGEASKTEQVFWESAEKHGTLFDYQGYLKKYPEGEFIDLAKSRIVELSLKSNDAKERHRLTQSFLTMRQFVGIAKRRRKDMKLLKTICGIWGRSEISPSFLLLES
jgi:hypothetical protein